MKKQAIQLAVVVLLLAGAVTAFLLLREDPDAPPSSGEEAAAPEEIYVLGGEPAPFVKQVEVENETDRFTIQNGAENLIHQQNNPDLPHRIEGMDPDTLAQSMLKSALNTAAALPAKQAVAREGEDLSPYGLTSPRGTVRVAYEEETVEMRVGDEAPGGEGTYVRVDDAVYLVDSNKLTNLLGSRYAFADRTVTPGNSESTQIGRVELSGGGLTEDVVIEKAEDDEISAVIGQSSYRITAPIQARVDGEKGIQPLQSVFGLGAVEVVGEAGFLDESAAAYGLSEPDGPYYQMVVQPLADQTGEGEDVPGFIAAFSRPDADGLVYAQCSLSPYVYRVAASDLPFLEMTLFDYQERMILLPRIDTVSEVEVRAGEDVYTFRLTGEGQELEVTLDGGELDPDNFRQFYQTLLTARYDGEASPEEEEALDRTQPPLLQYTYRYRDGSAESVLRFWTGGPRRALAALDDGPLYTVQSVYVDRVLEDLPKVAAGEEVKSYL